MSLSENVIYFDNNSTTKTSMKAKEAYNLIQDEYFANPSSQSILGLEANKLLEKSKVGIKKLLNANNYNLYITSGATEANNIILKTYLEKALKDKKTVVTSKLEHSSVLKLFKIYELFGLNVIYLNSKNIYSLEDLPELNDIYFASLMTYNNESGLFTDLKKFRKIFGTQTLIHTDITQMVGKVKTDIKDLEVDFATFSGHKFHSPKGVGGLISKKNLSINPLFIGGGQEDNIRPGTINLASIYSMFTALEEANAYINGNNETNLRDEFEKAMVSRISGIKIIGQNFTRLPNTSYLSIAGVNSDILVTNLKNVAIGNGSACNSYSHEISHVAKEMTTNYEDASSVIRVSFSRYNSLSEVNEAVNMINREVHYVRETVK